MKKFLRFIIYFFFAFLFFVIVLVVVAKLAENKIADIALKKVSENIEAPVSIEEVSFNLLRKFPYANIELYGVTLDSPEQSVSSDSLKKKSSSILKLEKLYISVKSKPLLKNKFEIVHVDISGAQLNYMVDTAGVTNIDFLLSTDADTSSVDTIPSKPLSVMLDDLSVWNVEVNYDDKSLNTKAKLKIPELKVNAEIQGDEIMASVIGKLNLTNLNFNGTNLYLMNNTDIQFDVNYQNDSVNIKHLNIDTDGAGFGVMGDVILGESIQTDIRFVGKDLELGELIKYAPEDILKEYGIEDVKGKVNMNATAKGVYADSVLPQIDLNISFDEGQLHTRDYPQLKNISFKGKASNGISRNNQTTQADFHEIYFETEKSRFSIAFSIQDLDHLKYMIKTDMEIHTEEFKRFIPDSIVRNLDGIVKLDFSTRGELPDSIDDDFVDYFMANTTTKIELIDLNIDLEPDLSIRNFSSVFHYEPNNFSVKNLNIDIPTYQFNLKNTTLNADFKGSINEISKLKLNVKDYHLETKGAVISGNLKLEDLDNPSYDTNTKIELALAETKALLPDSLVSELSGGITIDIQSKANLNMDSIADQAIRAAFENSIIQVKLHNITAHSEMDPLYKIENLSGSMGSDHRAIRINDLTGRAGGIDFSIDSTIIENLYNTVIKNQAGKLLVDTRISLGDIDYSMFAPFMASDTEKKDTSKETKSESIPANYTMELKGAASVRSLDYDSIHINDISALFNITDSVYIIDQFKFKAFNGEMNSSVKYTMKEDNKSVIETKHIIEKMDIHKLLADFDDFEDFYEPSIRAENLSGLFSTNLYSRFNMVDDSLVMKDVRVKGDFKLEEGGVYNYEPATNLSKFTGIDELDNIKFKTLDSKIFVFKNAIYVPETSIASTAVNIKAYGMQSFGEDYEYHLEIKLSDILFGKSKKQKRKESKAGDADFEDDRNMREIVAYSLDGKNKNGFDNEKLQGKMKTKIKLNQNLLNLRFHPEMFNFETKVYK